MEKLDNTGLGLIGAAIERVRKEGSMFGSALKKLVNSTEEELNDFLKRKIEKAVEAKPATASGAIDETTPPPILRLISSGEVIKIKALKGRDLIYQAGKVFKSFLDSDFRNWGLTKKGVATPATLVQVHEMVQSAVLLDIFKSLPGTWEQKWLSQSQLIEFCESRTNWLHQGGNATFFLIKKDENQSVDENNPGENLVVAFVFVRSGGLGVVVRRLEDDNVWDADGRRRVVVPQLMPSVS
ncbi:MAG: hypothetical protein WC441_02515 [Patescibacteria group bacterium]